MTDFMRDLLPFLYGSASASLLLFFCGLRAWWTGQGSDRD